MKLYKTPQLTNWETRDQSLAPSLTSGVSLDQNISNNIPVILLDSQIVSNEGEEAEHVLLLCSEEETEAQRDEMICPYSLLQTGDSQVNNLYRPAWLYKFKLRCFLLTTARLQIISSLHCPFCYILLCCLPSLLPSPKPAVPSCARNYWQQRGLLSQTLFVFSK